jgi:serine-type D-Ala-D-Ala carboxypeptidase (penicillin-binding protein 5/6)
MRATHSVSLATSIFRRMVTSLRLQRWLIPAALAGVAATVAAAPKHEHPHARPHAAKAAPAAAPAAPAAPVAPGEVPPPPTFDSKAFVLMDFDSGQILAQSNGEEPLPPASLTKMMTSYLVEQALKAGRLKPDEQVSVSLNAWCRGSSVESCMYLPLNGHASVMDMLRGIVVQSGNDAAKAMAEHMAGNEPAFAQLMNAEAKRIGMTHTNFLNSTGLPEAGHAASAHDLALLARAIIQNSATYYPIYAERTFTYNGIKQGNRNALLYTDPTVDGLKTGHTEEAGYCLTASSKRDGLRMISVIMGANSMQGRADQTRQLFNWAFSNYQKVTPFKADAVVQSVPVDFGTVDHVNAGVATDWNLTAPKVQAQAIKTSVTLNPKLEAPIAKGQVIGKVVATANGKTLGEQPLVAQDAVPQAGFMLRMWQHLRKLV